MKCSIQTLFGLCSKVEIPFKNDFLLLLKKTFSKGNFKDSDFYTLMFTATLFMIVKTSTHKWIKQLGIYLLFSR